MSHLKGIDGIILNNRFNCDVTNYAYFPVVFDESKLGFTRNDVFQKLEDNGIVARKYFYPLSNTYKCYRDRFEVNKTPIALKVSERVLTLPMYADLDSYNVEKICGLILEMLR